MPMTVNFTKIPNYFYENGLTKNPLLAAFLVWAFHRCRPINRCITFNQKEIEIEPYEFIFGLKTCSEETGITVQQLRSILKDLINRQVLQKSTGKSNNKFTVYKWSTERFRKKEAAQSTGKILENQQQRRYILHNKSKDLLFPQPAVACPPILQIPITGKIIPLSDFCANAYVFKSFLHGRTDPPPIFAKKESLSREKTMESSAVSKTEVTKPKRSMKSYFDRKKGVFCEIDKKVIDEWKEKFPHLDLAYEFRKMKDFLLANPKRKGTQTFVTKWLTRSERWRYQAQQNRIAYCADKDKMAIAETLKKIEVTDWENDPALQLPDSILRQYAL